MAIQSESDKLLKSAVAILPKAKQKGSLEFARRLFEGALEEDLIVLSPQALSNVISRALEAIDNCPKDTLAVEATDDSQTLVTVTISNRPFIIDSVLAELNTHGLEVELIAHPVIETEPGLATSLVVVVLTESTAAIRKDIKTALKYILQQVRLVTDDWKAMLLRVDEEMETFRTTPPPLPTERIAEAVQFLQWLANNHFTLMGLREYSYKGTRKSGELKPVPGSALGILRDDNLSVMSRGGKPVQLTHEIRDFLFGADPIIITKANMRSQVHRRTHLDYIGVKRFTRDGKLAGEVRIVGLFTSTAYTRSVMSIPILRHKANAVLENYRTDPASHSGKAMVNILETWPRDAMFQLDEKTLTEFVKVASQLEERPRIRALPRLDKFDRFVSIMVYVPRDRYDSGTRMRMAEYFAEVYDGHLSAFYPVFLDNGLVRIQFIIGRASGKTPKVQRAELERQITKITRTWSDRLSQLSEDEIGYQFPLAYQEHVDPEVALGDVALLNQLENDQQIELDFHQLDAETRVGLKLFHLSSAVPLSRRVPMLENLGFHVIQERTFRIETADGETAFIHDMVLENAQGDTIDLDALEPKLKSAIHAVWNRENDNDNFNALVLVAGLDWQLAGVMRAYARYLRQVRSRFTIHSMARILAAHPDITQNLADLFSARFDPSTKSRAAKQAAKRDDIIQSLELVHSSDDDAILRDFLNIIEATLRTNYYSPVLEIDGTEAAPTPVLAFKIDPSAVNIMPQPVPYREIFVSAPRVEGLHLRFGPVARGGLRWSDRAQDYRTEVLGLVKAQQVKNAVIVPVGSKGGFVPKQLPTGGDRGAWFEEGRASYKIFISSLLSLTDNLINGKVVPPEAIVRHDGDDPYFVVAADKGTSTFSDTANAISQERDFWLDDAFASGGSAGYDHKKMGITARGGWEAVKRHFREMDRDIQTQPFTTVGVGDMSGDVYGNGMLLSKQTRVIAAFDHRDIFIDPDPDVATSFKERKRLFDAGRSSWQDYKAKLISKGGGVYSRGAKKITLSKQAAEALGFQAGDHTPQVIMNAILKAPVDLMWFGGIGTYIRASHESDADADDRGNDSIRVTAPQLRCKVIGEGANLGVTHPARIEFNLLGGCCNSDAIDNSAGVNSSDVEVNIKIALAAAMKSGRLTRPKRNKLLESMTETVSQLVLRNNYLQTLSISLSERRDMEDFANQQRLMHSLEARNLLDRHVEDLPDDASLVERQAANTPLTRAEIGVLLAYAKIVALDDLVAGKVPDDPYLQEMLVDYFPPKMQKTYAKEIESHRLRREIIGTVLANSMINRGGPTFISRVSDHTGAKLDTIARAYVVVRDAFRLPKINSEIDALDNKISGEAQLELYAILQERVISQTIWFVRYGNFRKGLEAESVRYRKAVDALLPKLDRIVPDFLADRIKADTKRFEAAGVPSKLALTMARMPIAGLIPDILFASTVSQKSLDLAATAFFDITERFRIDRMVLAAREIETADYYDGLALDRALQSLHRARRDIVEKILKAQGGKSKGKHIWIEQHADAVESTREQIVNIVDQDHATVSRLTVAANVLADLARE
ncbi:MAG: NAD-glutamate dehydrogenase [Rhizobiaceae bacterium]|nr:NAD-glutamate dehydrogenase [Rhizobiaceae bacterium]